MTEHQHTDSEMLRFAVAEAMVESLPKALKQAARDPDTWSAANEGIQEHISTKAGGWVMRMVWRFFSRVVLFLVLGSIVYSIGGWGLVAKVFSAGGPQ